MLSQVTSIEHPEQRLKRTCLSVLNDYKASQLMFRLRKISLLCREQDNRQRTLDAEDKKTK